MSQDSADKPFGKDAEESSRMNEEESETKRDD
jgi:hypothetical protein